MEILQAQTFAGKPRQAKNINLKRNDKLRANSIKTKASLLLLVKRNLHRGRTKMITGVQQDGEVSSSSNKKLFQNQRACRVGAKIDAH